MTTSPKLLGSYSTPTFRRGDVVRCARRGEVRIVGLSVAPIPWPIGKTQQGARALVLYGDLAEAVKRESAEAVMHYWGVKANTFWLMRKALGVSQMTEGTTVLKSERLSPVLARAREAALPTLGSDERREKIAAARRGKPRPAHVVEAMRRGRTGKPHDEATRAKMRRNHVSHGVWSAEEDEAVRTLPAAEAAARTGRTLTAVYSRRRVLKVADGRAGRAIPSRRKGE